MSTNDNNKFSQTGKTFKKQLNEKEILNDFSIIERFNSIFSHTVGVVEIIYTLNNKRIVNYSIGFLIKSNIVLTSSKSIKQVPLNTMPSIIFYPTETKYINKPELHLINDFVKVSSYHFMPSSKLQDFSSDPTDEENHEKEWCVLYLTNILGEYIYSLNLLPQNYFIPQTTPIEKEKYKFFYLSYLNKNSNVNNNAISNMNDKSISNVEFISISIDNSRLFIKETEKINQQFGQKYKGKEILLLIPMSDNNFKTAINKCNSEGYLFAISDSESFLVGIYNGNNRSSIEALEKDFSLEPEYKKNKNSGIKFTDRDFFVLKIEEIKENRDINNIYRIIEDLKRDFYFNYGIKTFSYSIYQHLSNYFINPLRANVLLNYGEKILEKATKLKKVQIRNIDVELLLKRLINDSCVSISNKSITDSQCKPLEKLELKNQNISGLTMNTVLESFYLSKMLNSISIIETRIYNEHALRLAELLYHNYSNIEEIILHSNKVDIDSFIILLEALSTNFNIKIINLFNNSINYNKTNIDKISSINYTILTKTKKLYFRKMTTSTEIMKAFIKSLSSVCSEANNVNITLIKTQLEDCFLSNLELGNYSTMKAHISSSTKLNIRVANFSENPFNVKVMENFTLYLSHSPCLQQLYLKDCFISDKSFILLLGVLDDLPLLSVLDVSYNYISSISMEDLLLYLKKKEKVINEYLDTKMIENSSKRNKVNTSNNNESKITGLNDLNIKKESDIKIKNSIKDDNVTPTPTPNNENELIKSKLVLIQSPTKNISSSKFNAYNKTQSNEKAKLGYNQLELNLSYNNIEDIGVKTLLSDLNNKSLLLSLYLEKINIGNKGLHYIKKYIYKNNNIILLSIAHNNLIDEFFIKSNFGEGLKENNYIERLYINDNYISKDIIKSMLSGLTQYIRNDLSNLNKATIVHKENFKIICDELLSIDQIEAKRHNATVKLAYSDIRKIKSYKTNTATNKFVDEKSNNSSDENNEDNEFGYLRNKELSHIKEDDNVRVNRKKTTLLQDRKALENLNYLSDEENNNNEEDDYSPDDFFNNGNPSKTSIGRNSKNSRLKLSLKQRIHSLKEKFINNIEVTYDDIIRYVEFCKPIRKKKKNNKNK